jgi:hypothetical protein
LGNFFFATGNNNKNKTKQKQKQNKKIKRPTLTRSACKYPFCPSLAPWHALSHPKQKQLSELGTLNLHSEPSAPWFECACAQVGVYGRVVVVESGLREHSTHADPF